MKSTMVWVCGLALVWTGVQVSPASAEEELRTEPTVQIKVGPKIITDPNKQDHPVPQVPFNDLFEVEVQWIDIDPESTVEFELSDFKIMTFEQGVWSWDQPKSLQLMDEKGKAQKIVFLYSGEPTTTMMMGLGRPEFEGSRPQLIMFKQTVKVNGEVHFEHDPPWVGIPPTG